MQRRIRMGMVGGGRDAFIGAVHRMAAGLDNSIELVCGAFSSEPEKSRASGRDLFLPEERCYGTWQEMLDAETALPEGERMDFVAIVTPNHVHHPVARASLEAGFHVMSDKPMTRTSDEARELVSLVESTGLLFGLTHNYTGYPMVKEARHRIRSGELGAVRKLVVEYPQGWLHDRLEASGQKQADWRTDPARSGAAGCMGDIGTHAENLAEYITGLRIESLCADLTTFVDGRALDDDGNVLLRFEGGGRGVLYASQVSIDEENALAIRMYGERGGLEWHQEEPNTLILKWPDRPRETRAHQRDRASLERSRRAILASPPGTPRDFFEAFANLYRDFARTRSTARLRTVKSRCLGVARVSGTSNDGLRGMQFI